ncbi:MAG: cytochrome c biogenesis protein ResB [Syntrophales bacterium]|nr:cytochrome c biogenesis protein ResB [Syntrophales bacterium]MDD5532361.1 cytochrome c biogenesis protein ResB [Syntrophales bacterium]
MKPTRLFASTRTAVGLLALIAAASTAGTFAPSLDVFRSAWFALLLILLALNLAVCTAQRTPALWKGIRSSGPSSRKEAAGRLGLYFIHGGVLVIIVGALIGAVSGFSGEMRIAEKESAGVFHAAPQGAARELGFSVRLDRFLVEHYSGGAPKTFRSDITFVRDGAVLGGGVLLVNHPVSFQGLRFFQASYGREAVAAELTADDGRRRAARRMAAGDKCFLPDGTSVRVLRIEEDLMRMGPAVKLQVESKEKEALFWVFQRIEELEEQYPDVSAAHPQFNPGLFKPWRLRLNGVEGRYYAGIQVARDPGAPWVAAGAVLMLAGLALLFFRIIVNGVHSSRSGKADFRPL